MSSAGLTDAARFLMAAGDADADGVTAAELAAFLREQLTVDELIRLRVGCAYLVRVIDGMMRDRG